MYLQNSTFLFGYSQRKIIYKENGRGCEFSPFPAAFHLTLIYALAG
jgi:hypothetical protein